MTDVEIDENTWAGFDALVKSAAKFDTAHIEYGQLFTIMVCSLLPCGGPIVISWFRRYAGPGLIQVNLVYHSPSTRLYF